MYCDTLDTDISFDVPVRRSALFSVNEFDVPVRPMDAKGLIVREKLLVLRLYNIKNAIQYMKTVFYIE